MEWDLASVVQSVSEDAVKPKDAGAGEGRECEADAAPHRDHVSLNMLPSGRWCLTNLISLEKVELPLGARYRSEFDPEGFGVLVAMHDNGEEEVTNLDHLFRFMVFQLPENSDYIITGADSSFGKQQVSVNTQKSKYKEFSLTMPIGATSAKIQLSGAWFRWPRQGALAYISAKCVYEQLAFSQFDGKPWRWTHGSLQRWELALSELGLVGHVQRSCHVPFVWDPAPLEHSAKIAFSRWQLSAKLCGATPLDLTPRFPRRMTSPVCCPMSPSRLGPP